MGLFAEGKLIVAALLSELERGRVIRRPGSIRLKGLRELSGKGRISPISVMDSRFPSTKDVERELAPKGDRRSNK